MYDYSIVDSFSVSTNRFGRFIPQSKCVYTIYIHSIFNTPVRILCRTARFFFQWKLFFVMVCGLCRKYTGECDMLGEGTQMDRGNDYLAISTFNVAKQWQTNRLL